VQALLIAARALHFAAAISLAGTLGFACLIAEPAFRRSGTNDASVGELRRRLDWIAWASLALALISGTAWLGAVASEMSGKPLGAVFSQGIATTVLTRTRFGEDWLVRLTLAGLLAVCLVARNVPRPRASAALGALALGLAATMLASLAWAGHGAATPGAPGNLHMAGDVMHLLAAGFWLGTLPPLVLLLAATRRAADARWVEVARIATRRFSRLAVASVIVLLAGGLINTWFLAGSIPALVGTDYGRLLLGKIALFIAMLMFASVNLLRLTPRLAGAVAVPRTVAQLQRNALLEVGFGVGVLAIVGVLGRLPPGLHTEPGWPFPLRLDFAALTAGSRILLGIAFVLFCACAIGAVAAAAAGKYRSIAAFGAGLALATTVGWAASFPGLERAYPTSFYAPARPYDASSVAAGAALYADNCAACHGAEGEGNGPAAAGLPIRPSNLTEAHLFAHSPGDLFWWVSQGRGHGAMPGFAVVMTPDQRWDVVNFVRARAAGVLAREVGPEVTAAVAYPVPDFVFETGGAQETLSGMLQKGPVLLMLFGRPAPDARLQQLAGDRPRLGAAGLQIVAIGLDQATETASEEAGMARFVARVSPEVKSALALFRSPADGGESELLLDRNGNVRVGWTAAGQEGLPDAATLVSDAEAAAGFAVAAPSHAGHSH
jgi:putative copper resistance protein D